MSYHDMPKNALSTQLVGKVQIDREISRSLRIPRDTVEAVTTKMCEVALHHLVEGRRIEFSHLGILYVTRKPVRKPYAIPYLTHAGEVDATRAVIHLARYTARFKKAPSLLKALVHRWGPACVVKETKKPHTKKER